MEPKAADDLGSHEIVRESIGLAHNVQSIY